MARSKAALSDVLGGTSATTPTDPAPKSAEVIDLQTSTSPASEPDGDKKTTTRQRRGSDTRSSKPAARKKAGTGTTAAKNADAATEPAGHGAEDIVRASNLLVPVPLKEQSDAERIRLRLSSGQFIIYAIEQTFDELADLINPPAVAGGRFFAESTSRQIGAEGDAKKTPYNFRMRVRDYEVFDDLVAKLNAGSRGRLVTAAFTAYFKAH